ncbi:tRNA (adenosine(37)-N6)-threonylcarbamoyltransferase complex dimerization subunit type 1 TsaB [Sphingobacterium bovistauri]|uniref:tRNA (Adenosine(37)-N6)-threonylcarbamoyltransferase complex dimerization subunit type 1 TsaB n=1 Tax=Sphingobacterium bovistauri TaxID=2781959 RepID=A0ABS7Z6E5_9SPHI|nr:tRNA (adenosine(37)-N6)-threonylcarbamoyltransferase complex dimerization subunit type 1 TsaB [Sphingobacterium bovistauri]MCA5005583.1 tRNA (adenosine(37)-N6)-threonylcarbamoyltransferase complex dimerization subunit type 1 TsaB [Sphingobacterium bovistauri]
MSTYILQIDTATEVCSVSLSLNGELVNKIDASEPNLHASKLTVFIDDLLQESKLSYQDLSAVVVSKGPGSYTGLRIGVSTAKGLCYALDIPLLAVNTLESMYAGYKVQHDKNEILYVPMLDARRMEVYQIIFDCDGAVLQETEAAIIDADTFVQYADKKLCLFGTGATKLKEVFSGVDNITIDENYKHSSTYLSKKAYEKFTQQDFEDLIYFEPYYLKEFIAMLPKAIKL